MTKKKDPESQPKSSPEITPLDNPYDRIKQRDETITKELTELKHEVARLQTTWDRLCNLAENPVTQPVAPIPSAVQKVIKSKDMTPIWEKERLAAEQTSDQADEATPQSRRGLIMVVGLIIILIIVALFLKSKGWNCLIPGLGG